MNNGIKRLLAKYKQCITDFEYDIERFDDADSNYDRGARDYCNYFVADLIELLDEEDNNVDSNFFCIKHAITDHFGYEFEDGELDGLIYDILEIMED